MVIKREQVFSLGQAVQAILLMISFFMLKRIESMTRGLNSCWREYNNARGLTLNKEKCIFKMPQLEFIGYLLSIRGIDPTESKVEAVVKAREPETAAEVRGFMGFVNFSAKFIPNLANIAEPLRHLTRADIIFKWEREQQEAFNALKKALASAETLTYSDRDTKTRVIADASPVSVGAVLAQEHYGVFRPVYYASRSLSAVERRLHFQTEREALALVCACGRFHVYLYGKHF